MITSKESWDNPPSRNNERENLSLLLKEIDTGIVEYEETTSEDIKKLEERLTKRRSCSIEESRDYLSSLLDYCFGNILKAENYNE